MNPILELLSRLLFIRAIAMAISGKPGTLFLREAAKRSGKHPLRAPPAPKQKRKKRAPPIQTYPGRNTFLFGGVDNGPLDPIARFRPKIDPYFGPDSKYDHHLSPWTERKPPL